MNVETALKFYARCTKEKVTDEKGRIQLLIKMAQDGQLSISKTNKTKAQVVKDLQLHYKNILSIKSKQENN